MQLLKELPKEQGFFNRYATLIPVLHKLSYLTQAISGLTEYGVFFALLLPKVREISPEYQFIIAGMGAAVLVAVVEIGMRVFAPYSVRTVLYKRWSGLDLPMSIFIWLFCLGLFGVSLFTSFQGSHDAIHEAYTTGKTRDKIDEQLSDEKQAILSRFAADSLQIAQNHDGQIVSLQDAGKAAYDAKKEQLRSLERKEKATDQSFLSQKSKLREEMAGVTAETAGKVADLQTKKADALDKLLNTRESKTGEAKTTATTGVAKLETKGNQYGGYLGWFTIICHIFFAIAITMYEITKKGSDIQERAIIGTYHFDPSVFGEWWNVFSHKYQTALRTKIRAWGEKTPDVPKPNELPTLFEYNQQQPRVVIGGFKPMATSGASVVTNATDSQRIDGDFSEAFAVLENGNFHSDLARLKSIVADSTYSDRNNGERIDGERGTGKTKGCKHCTNQFEHKHWNAQYCSDACRIAAWEKRTGRKFNPSTHHKKP